MKNQYYYLLGIIFSWLWSSMVIAAPIKFTNVYDFIEGKSEVITFEVSDKQATPTTLSSRFSNIETITFEQGASISQEDSLVTNGAPISGTSYAKLKPIATGNHPAAIIRITFKNAVDAVGAYWGGIDYGHTAMTVIFTDGTHFAAKPLFSGLDIISQTSSKCNAINGFLGIDSNYGKRIKEVIFFSVEETVSVDNIYFGDANGRHYGTGEGLLPSSFYKDQCETILTPTTECIIYGINDRKLNNSEFFLIYPEDKFKVYPLNLAYRYSGYDIESLDVHPTTGELFAASNHNTTDNKDKGFLFKVNKQHAGLTPVGSTGFDAIVSLSFHPNGSLWGWVDNVGLIEIDPTNAESTLKLGSHYNIEGISWSTDGSVLYIMGKNSLYAYNPTRKTFAEKCNNFPLSTQAIDTLNDNSLLFISYENKRSTLHSFDINSCTINTTVPATFIDTRFTDVKGIASSCN